MIDFLLKEMEKSANPIFTKNELVSISSGEFERLKKLGVSAFRQPSERELARIRLPRCQHGCSLTVSPVGNRLEAVCLDHPEEGPIPIQRDDLFRYIFSIENFLQQIRKSNNIEGGHQKIPGGYHYIGYKLYDDKRIGFLFIPKMEKSEYITLSGLKHICEDDDFIIALTPVFKIDDISLKKAIRRNNIIQTPILPILDPKSFELQIDGLIAKYLKPKAVLTARQKKGYDKHHNLCKDRIYLTGEVPGHHGNLISVNDNDVRIPDSLFLLCLRFVQELKKKKGGWINTQTLHKERIIPDPNSYQIYSNLRSEIKGYLIENNGRKFIESDGSKNYRISTHPDFVTYNKGKLNRHDDARIRKIAGKLPKSRHRIGTKRKR